MRKSLLAAAVVALGVTALAGTSQAQPGPNRGGPEVELQLHFGAPFHGRQLSNREIRFRLRAQGYHEIRFLDRNRRTVIVRAEDWRNRDYILTVSAYSGRVLNRQALFRPGFPRPYG